jgi:hypothetical protein
MANCYRLLLGEGGVEKVRGGSGLDQVIWFVILSEYKPTSCGLQDPRRGEWRAPNRVGWSLGQEDAVLAQTSRSLPASRVESTFHELRGISEKAKFVPKILHVGACIVCGDLVGQVDRTKPNHKMSRVALRPRSEVNATGAVSTPLRRHRERRTVQDGANRAERALAASWRRIGPYLPPLEHEAHRLARCLCG